MQTSRFGRLALLSREVGGAHLAEGGEAHLQHKVDIKVNVSVVSLESRGGGRGRLVEGAGRDQINPTVVDFKQFKKVHQFHGIFDVRSQPQIIYYLCLFCTV